MTKELTHPILTVPIETLSLSGEFKSMASHNGYHTLAEIIADSMEIFPQRPASGYRLLKELIDFLAMYNLHNLIDD